MSRATLCIFALFVLIFAAACDKVPLLAPTQSTITVSVSSTTIAVNGTAQVIATVTEQAGTPVQNGTLVTFVGSLGTFDPPEAATVNGKATSIFRASGQSGTAKIGATSGSAKATEVEVKIGGAAAETVSLRAEPANVPITGGTVTLIAVVTDSSGNALVGAPVSFSTDNGQLSSSSGVTDANGEARTSLTTNRETVARATVGAKNAQVTIRATTLPTASISVAPAAPLVGLPVTFTVTPGTATTGTAIRNVMLDFGDGTAPANLGAITAATSVSHVYTRADTFTVTVTVTDVSGQQTANSTLVTVQRAVVSVTLTGPSTGQVGTSVSFTVGVTNSNNVPIRDVIVSWGDASSSTLGPTGGSVSKTYTRSGSFDVVATATDASGNTYRATHRIEIAPPNAFDVTLDAQSADPAVSISCTANYPKTCNTRFFGAGIRLTFVAGTSGLGFSTPTGYLWDYGDGTVEPTTSRQVDHVFRRPGEFIVRVTVSTSNGQTGTQRITIILE